ncbi:diguanylate cyclase [Sphingobium yanoikuyae]|uniref:diguanylate cyclase n=1 Tax=Sphingobium yanoikuyae TaxID=13690 RepID=UPI0028A901FD|nr:diguanylate cyclase [Sphingobium yanoikuyae]
MRPTEPLPLHHSWPLYDLREHLAPVVLDQDIAGNEAALADRGLGLWHCNLTDNSLNWTKGVYDIFGLEPGSIVSRPLSVSLYAHDSREAMERLRAYAIRHQRGFTLDVDIRRPDGSDCAMRLIAAPVLLDGETVALHGVKQWLPKDVGAPVRLEPTTFFIP